MSVLKKSHDTDTNYLDSIRNVKKKPSRIRKSSTEEKNKPKRIYARKTALQNTNRVLKNPVLSIECVVAESVLDEFVIPEPIEMWNPKSDPIFISPKNYIPLIEPEIRRRYDYVKFGRNDESIMPLTKEMVRSHIHEVLQWLHIYGRCFNVSCSSDCQFYQTIGEMDQISYSFKLIPYSNNKIINKTILTFYFYMDKWYIHDGFIVLGTRYYDNLLYNDEFMKALLYSIYY
jgi:hypothetical protein